MANKKIINNSENAGSESEQLTRKRGRPKGSKNTTIRKDHNIQNAEPGKNANTTRFAMALNKLPKIDINNSEEVYNRINEYYSICAAHDLKPTIAMLAFSFGVSRITLFNWINGRNDTVKNIESVNAIKTAYNLISSMYETYLNDGSINPVSAFFLLKNNAGYKDTTDFVVTANQEQTLSLSDIANRANLLSDI